MSRTFHLPIPCCQSFANAALNKTINLTLDWFNPKAKFGTAELQDALAADPGPACQMGGASAA